MTNNETNCESIQQIIALGQALTRAQKTHVSSCSHCQHVQQQMQQLDRLVEAAIQNPVPQGFAERVMASLPVTVLPVDNVSLFGEKMLALISRSRTLQTLLLGLGMVIGFTQIVRFILSIFIASMAAAC